MKVLLINGSPRKNGETAHSLALVEKVLNKSGIETVWFQLGENMVKELKRAASS